MKRFGNVRPAIVVLWVLIALTPVLASCGGGGSDSASQLPLFFRLEGTAMQVVDDQTLDCHIDFIVELSGETMRTDEFVEYVGTMGGEAGRRLLSPDGSGWALAGDAFSQVRARLTFPASVTIESINLPPGPVHDPPSFFEEIVQFTGSLGPQDLISGDWLCAPFFTDLGGFADDSLFADGTWFTETITNQP